MQDTGTNYGLYHVYAAIWFSQTVVETDRLNAYDGDSGGFSLMPLCGEFGGIAIAIVFLWYGS